MPVTERIQQWDESGKLYAEFSELSAILTKANFTRQQIVGCFETMRTLLRLMVVNKLGRHPTLEEFRAEFDAFRDNQAALIELCKTTVYNSKKPERDWRPCPETGRMPQDDNATTVNQRPTQPNEKNIDPTKPTSALPGSDEKVAVLTARHEAGLPLWHDNDQTNQSENLAR